MIAYHAVETAVIAVAVAGSAAFVFRRSAGLLWARLRGRPLATKAGGCAACDDCGSCGPASAAPVEKPIAILRRPR